MSIPKVIGIEQEYAVSVAGSREFDPIDLSFQVVNAYDKVSKAIWDYDRESPLVDARGFRREGEETIISSRANYRINNLLGNGARFYVDHAHPEYSTPECLSARDAVALDRAGERIVLRAAEQASRGRGQSEILIIKNNTDHKGNSYGTHENYLMSTEVYQRLFPRYPSHPELTMRVLVPFLVTRQIFCGAGKTGAENGTPACDFQISQRADFFETVMGGQTTHTRPIINSRDEPHADKERYSRLHVIIGDANMSEVSSWLKIGVTQIVLGLIEDGEFDIDLALDDPVRAVVAVSHDVTCRKKVAMKSGPAMSPVEIQRRIHEVALDRLSVAGRANVEQRALLARWGRVLDMLSDDPNSLDREIDWVIKRRLIERAMGRRGFGWRDPRSVRMDIQYHDLRPGRGLYLVLEGEGRVERLLDDATIEHFVTEPPEDTRAYFRSQCLRRYRDSISHANWDVLTFDVGEQRDRKVSLLDPLRGTKAHVQELLDSSPDAKVLLDKLTQE